MFMRMLPALLFVLIPNAFSQGVTAPTGDSPIVQIPISPDEPQKSLDEIITLRFRLGAQWQGYSIAAINETGQAGQFFLRGLTLEQESKPHSMEPRRVDAKSRIVVGSADIHWPEIDYVYVEASRRLRIELLPPDGGQGVIRIPQRSGREYEIVDESRLPEVPSSDFEQEVSILGLEGDAKSIKIPAQKPLQEAASQVGTGNHGDRLFLSVSVRVGTPSGK